MANMTKDFPSQFQDMPHIETIAEAVERELDEVRQMFSELGKPSDISAAVDKQLDGIGDIVVLSRAQAGLLARNGITFPVIDDERYRRFLTYKILRNTSNTSIEDVLTAIRMLWGVEPEDYEEPEPATMSISFKDPGGSPDAYDDIPPIKAGGVGIHIRATSERRTESRIYAGAFTSVHEDLKAEIVTKDSSARIKLTAGAAAFLSDERDIPPMKRTVKVRAPCAAGCAALIVDTLHIEAIPRKGGMNLA